MNTKATAAVVLVIGIVMILRNRKLPQGIRNDNPLNIRANNIEWRGKVGQSNGFVVFDSPLNGIRAAARLLRTYRDKYALDTIAGVVDKWAPPSENNTGAYIQSMSQKTGVGINERLTTDDYPNLIAAMIYHENGQQPYPNDLIYSGFEQGFLT